MVPHCNTIVTELTHTVDITGPSNPLSAGGKHTLTCTVTSDLSPTVKWLDPDNNEVDGSDVAVVMDDMVANGNTTTLLLHFDPLKTSHGGTYACVSTISEPASFRKMTRDVEVQREYIGCGYQFYIKTFECHSLLFLCMRFSFEGGGGGGGGGGTSLVPTK